MHDKWPPGTPWAGISCSSIPGSLSGPFPASRAFLLAKRADVSSLWALCTAPLQQVRQKWPRLAGDAPLPAVFALTSLGVDATDGDRTTWSVGFESRGAFWVYVTVDFVGTSAIGHSCDT